MNHPKTNSVLTTPRIGLAALAILILTGCSVVRAEQGKDNRAPDVGSNTTLIPPGDTNKVHFHVYAEGVQVYVCTQGGTAEFPTYSWVFNRPEASLFDADGNLVGFHYAYAGPTRPAWETASGSFVVGAVIPPRITVDANSIPWLLLGAVTNSGPGVLDGTTFIQRVNTVGGLAPTTGCDAAHVGEESEVPYTAEYYFYRATK
jgi:hypothetical protein